jgi:hypothetical protein
MKIYLTILLCSLFINSYGQEIVKVNIESYPYMVDNKLIDNYYDLEDYFYKYTESGSAYDSYRFYNRNAKKLAVAGAVTLTLGFALFATDGGDCCTDQQAAGVVIALITIPLEIIALTFYIMSSAKKHRSIELYNELESKQVGVIDHYKISLKINLDKVGLIMQF